MPSSWPCRSATSISMPFFAFNAAAALNSASSNWVGCVGGGVWVVVCGWWCVGGGVWVVGVGGGCGWWVWVVGVGSGV